MLGLRETTVTVKSTTGSWASDGWHSGSSESRVISAIVEPTPGTLVYDRPDGEADQEDWVLFVRVGVGALKVAQDDSGSQGDEVEWTIDGQTTVGRVVWRNDWRTPGMPYRYTVYGIKELMP